MPSPFDAVSTIRFDGPLTAVVSGAKESASEGSGGAVLIGPGTLELVGGGAESLCPEGAPGTPDGDGVWLSGGDATGDPAPGSTEFGALPVGGAACGPS